MIMSDSLYQKSYFSRLPELKDLAPEAFRAFLEFDQKLLLRENSVNHSKN